MDVAVKQARRDPWLVAWDANMNPEDIKKNLSYKSRHMIVEAGARRRRSHLQMKSWNGEFIERTYDYVIESESPREDQEQVRGGRFCVIVA